MKSKFKYEHEWMKRYPIEEWIAEVQVGRTRKSYDDWACDRWEDDYWENLPEENKNKESFQGTCV